MKNKRLKTMKLLTITGLLIIEISSVFLTWKSFTERKTSLEEVGLKNLNNNNNLAIMLNNGDGNYQESDSGTFPTTGYQFNTEKSGCITSSGEKLNDALIYDAENYQVKFLTNQTGSCYLYFDKMTGVTALELLNQKPSNLNQILEGGLYRYQGTASAVTNNYICFGTSDKDTCTSDTDKYMYRIIGINPEGQFKLIKKEALNTAYYWHNSNSNINWPNSDLYKGLNGIENLSNQSYQNLFLGSDFLSSDENDTWNKKIVATWWKYGDITDNTQGANAVYTIENGWSITRAKIGLMYLHDYYYAYQNEGLNCSGLGEYHLCKTSWLYLWNKENDSMPLSAEGEWTISRWGWNNGLSAYGALYVHLNGYVNTGVVNFKILVRPVFFLEDTVKIKGDGTLTSPYVITN